MAKGRLETPYVVPKEQLRTFRARLQYGRRLGSNEVFEVDRVLFEQLLSNGFSMEQADGALRQVGSLPAFVLLAAEILSSINWTHAEYGAGDRALLTLRVRRKLPPFQSVQRYVVGNSVKVVVAKVDLPKRERTPKAVAAVKARRLVSLEG